MSAPTELTNQRLFTGELVVRFLKHFDERRKYHQTRYNRRAPARYKWTVRGISELTGAGYERVVHHLWKRDRAMSFQDLDRYMWATGTSVMDLIHPQEIRDYLLSLDVKSLDTVQRMLWTSLQKKLDTIREMVSNEASDQPESAQPTGESDKPSTINRRTAPKRGGR